MTLPVSGTSAEFDGPVPARAGIGHGGDFGCDRGWLPPVDRLLAGALLAAAFSVYGIMGGVQRFVLLVSDVEAGGADSAAVHGGVGGAAAVPGKDFRADLG